jgi:hypothetical protein
MGGSCSPAAVDLVMASRAELMAAASMQTRLILMRAMVR